MSEHDPSLRKRKTVAATIGGVVGGLLGADVVYRAQAGNFISDLYDKHSTLHESYRVAKRNRAAAEAELAVKAEEAAYYGERPPAPEYDATSERYIADYEQVLTEMGKIEQSPKFQEKLTQFQKTPQYQSYAEMKEALDYLKDEPDMLFKAHFTEQNGVPVTHLHIKNVRYDHEKGALVEEAAPRIFSIRGVKPTPDLDLRPYADELCLNIDHNPMLGQSEWFEAATKALAAEQEKLAPHYERIFKSVAPRDWVPKQIGHPETSSLVSAVLLGAITLGSVAAFAAGVGGHSRRLLQEKKDAAANPSTATLS